MTTDTTVSNLIINKLTQQQYDGIVNPSDTELYMVTDGQISYNDLDNKPVVDQTYNSSSTNAQSGVAVAQALSGVSLPDQTGQNGKFLGTDGTDASWESIDLSSKQDASTACTHTASTAVGDSSQPVYIASNGSATAISYKFWVGTQAEYDLISPKDNNTLYFIKETQN